MEGKTNNKIKDLLVSGVLDCDTVVVLVNAIYFKADWLSKFDVKLTTKEDFYGLSGQNSKVDLMSIRKKKYQYFDNDEVKLPLPPFQMIELPYKEEQMSMLILLPKDKNGLIELEKGLTGEVLRNIHHACSSRTVDVWLPRFRLEETYKLVPVLQKLGVTKLFSDADLSGVADIPLVVSEVVHKAFVGTSTKEMLVIKNYWRAVIDAHFRSHFHWVINCSLFTFVQKIVLEHPGCQNGRKCYGQFSKNVFLFDRFARSTDPQVHSSKISIPLFTFYRLGVCSRKFVFKDCCFTV